MIDKNIFKHLEEMYPNSFAFDTLKFFNIPCNSKKMKYKFNGDNEIVFFDKNIVITITINSENYEIKKDYGSYNIILMYNLKKELLSESFVKKIDDAYSILDNIDVLQAQYTDNGLALRKKLLDCAIQGKLVEQRFEEGTGEELYQQIQKEKEKLIKEGKIKKQKPLAEITEKEKPFKIPKNWKWVRWGNLSNSIQYGFNAPAKSQGSIKMVRISDIQDGKINWNTVPFCDISEDEISTYLLGKNDILFARTGGTVGKSYIVKDLPEKSIYAGYLIRTQYSSLLSPEYLYYFMKSNLYWRQLRSGTIATAQPNCNGQTLSKMLLPLPPLAEQKRIVAKLEELLPLCNQLK